MLFERERERERESEKIVIDYTKTSLPLHFRAVRPRTVAKCNGIEALWHKVQFSTKAVSYTHLTLPTILLV